MISLASIKESVFGVFYIVNESSARSNTGQWNVRLIILGYFIDTGQVRENVCNPLLVRLRFHIYICIWFVLVSEPLRIHLLFSVFCLMLDIHFVNRHPNLSYSKHDLRRFCGLFSALGKIFFPEHVSSCPLCQRVMVIAFHFSFQNSPGTAGKQSSVPL